MFETYNKSMDISEEEYNKQCQEDIVSEYFWDVNTTEYNDYEFTYVLLHKSKFTINLKRTNISYINILTKESNEINKLINCYCEKFENEYDNIIDWKVSFKLNNTNEDLFQVLVEPIIGFDK